MIRIIFILALGLLCFGVQKAAAVPGLDAYAQQMTENMQKVIEGQSLDTAFPWKLSTTAHPWEAGFRKGLKSIEPVSVKAAAIAMHWTFFRNGTPIYVAQLIVMPTENGPKLMRLERVWISSDGEYPSWMVSIQGRPPNEWPDHFRPWAKLLAAFQKSATPQSCPGLSLANSETLTNWVPEPYRSTQMATLNTLKSLRQELCKMAYASDASSLLPVRQHFNLVNGAGQIRGGVVLDFTAGAKGLAITNPQFKKIGVPN